tara:strand:+ start:2120 stop:3619 length:1500 start_codon:yes stop_codon:yes gene_type:complete
MSTVTSVTKAGDFVLSERFLLTSYRQHPDTSEALSIDIRQLVTELQIYESISHTTLSGRLTLTDGASVLDDLPLTGHELLEFSLHTPGMSPKDTDIPTGYDFTSESGHPMFIYKVSNIVQPNQGVKIYTLEFCSREEIRSSQRKVSRAFTGPVHEIVHNILRTDLKSKKIYQFEPTKGINKYVMPKLSPFKCIKFMQSEAISANNVDSSGYYFYETRTGFNFKSLEGMISKGKKGGKYKEPVATYTNTPVTQGGKMYDSEAPNLFKVYEFKIVNRFDSLTNIRNGLYGSRLVTYNAFTKQFKELDFEYLTSFEKQRHVGQTKQTSKENPVNSFMPIFNYEEGKLMSQFSEGKYMFESSTQGMHDTTQTVNDKSLSIGPPDIENTLQKAMAQQRAYDSFTIEIKVPGNTGVSAGDVISFETLTYGGPGATSNNIDPYLSGNYLVTHVRHLMLTTEHITTLTCAKDSVSAGYPPEPLELLNKEKNDSKKDYSTNDVDVIVS